MLLTMIALLNAFAFEEVEAMKTGMYASLPHMEIAADVQISRNDTEFQLTERDILQALLSCIREDRPNNLAFRCHGMATQNPSPT